MSLGYIVALSVPCSVLVAVLMTFGRLSQDNEITALRAGGVNLASVLIGPLGAAVLLAIGLTLFNNHVLPETNHAFANLLIDIGRMRPTVKLQEGVFISDFPGYNLLVQSVNGRTNEMRGVTLYQVNPEGPPTTIVARRGFLSYTPDGRTAVLELEDGEIHEVPGEEQRASKYRRVVFKTHVIHIPGAGGFLERTVRETRSDREMSAASLAVEADSARIQYGQAIARQQRRMVELGLDSPARPPTPLEWLAGAWAWITGQSDPLAAVTRGRPVVPTEVEMWRIERLALRKRIAELTVEYHKKFSLPAACVVFVLIGAPLGMRVRRAGPGVAFVSVGFFLFYYLCLVGGEELANRLLLPPWLAMWLPNIVLGLMGLDWTLRACELRRPARRSARRLPAAA
jgi:lipopolysaccharide export system permease protein